VFFVAALLLLFTSSRRPPRSRLLVLPSSWNRICHSFLQPNSTHTWCHGGKWIGEASQAHDKWFGEASQAHDKWSCASSCVIDSAHIMYNQSSKLENVRQRQKMATFTAASLGTWPLESGMERGKDFRRPTEYRAEENHSLWSHKEYQPTEQKQRKQ
jgi:hypothetical protein